MSQIKEERVALLTGLHDNLVQLRTEMMGWIDTQASCSFSDIGMCLTEARIEQYQDALQRAQAEKLQRQESLQQMRDEAEQLRLLLDISDDSGFDQLTDAGMAASAVTLQFLREERQMREQTVRDLARKIAPLWDMLGVEADERQSFFKSHVGLGQEVICACETELQRLQDLKQERMQYLVDEQRAFLFAAWGQLRSGLPCPEMNGDLSDDLLRRYKEETARVQALANQAQPLLAWIERREAIIQSRAEYDELRSDPARLMGRTKHDRERQKREEELRREIEGALPKLNMKLRSALEQWTVQHGEPLYYEGRNYLEDLEADLDDERRAKEEAKLRKQAVKAQQAAQVQPSRPRTATVTSASRLPTPQTPRSTHTKLQPVENITTPRRPKTPTHKPRGPVSLLTVFNDVQNTPPLTM